MEETPNNQSLQMYLCAQSTGRVVLVCTGRRATCILCRGPPIRQRQRNFLEGPLPIACSDNLLQGHSGWHRHIDLQTTMGFSTDIPECHFLGFPIIVPPSNFRYFSRTSKHRNGLRHRKTLPCITVHIMLVPPMFPGAAQDPKVNRLVWCICPIGQPIPLLSLSHRDHLEDLQSWFHTLQKSQSPKFVGHTAVVGSTTRPIPLTLAAITSSARATRPRDHLSCVTKSNSSNTMRLSTHRNWSLLAKAKWQWRSFFWQRVGYKFDSEIDVSNLST